VILRARITEAAERVAKGDSIAWADLAAELEREVRELKDALRGSPTA